MSKPEYHIASFSGGKDSTAMVLHMIERGDHLDEVMFCDTTMEFPAMYRHVEKIRKVVEEAGIKFTKLEGPRDFEQLLLDYRPKKKNSDLAKHRGKSWPSPLVRWCTRDLKIDVIDKHLRDLRKKHTVVQYVGIAADEQHRMLREQQKAEGKRYPLVQWGWTEKDALQYCTDSGYSWEGLYEIFNRVSCWCCPFKSLEELRKLRLHFPNLWLRLQTLDDATWRQFRADYSVQDLNKRFALEDALTEVGESIKNRGFFTDLKSLLANETTIEGILLERNAQHGTETRQDAGRRAGQQPQN
jgi:3'-phosphoadenosine 5'-phosphosulfate sulfotransferase (PAPS reductase)/FAD synthetase